MPGPGRGRGRGGRWCRSRCGGSRCHGWSWGSPAALSLSLSHTHTHTLSLSPSVSLSLCLSVSVSVSVSLTDSDTHTQRSSPRPLHLLPFSPLSALSHSPPSLSRPSLGSDPQAQTGAVTGAVTAGAARDAGGVKATPQGAPRPRTGSPWNLGRRGGGMSSGGDVVMSVAHNTRRGREGGFTPP